MTFAISGGALPVRDDAPGASAPERWGRIVRSRIRPFVLLFGAIVAFRPPAAVGRSFGASRLAPRRLALPAVGPLIPLPLASAFAALLAFAALPEVAGSGVI